MLKNLFNPDKDEDIGRTVFAYFLLPVVLILILQKTVVTTFVKNQGQFALTAIFILALLYVALMLRALLSVNQRSRLSTASYGASGNVAMANLAILLTALYLPVTFLDLASGRTGDAHIPAPSDTSTVTTNSNPDLHIDSDSIKPATQVMLTGEIGNGASSRLATLLNNRESTDSPIRHLVLNSDGGNIFEARGIAKLVREHQLDTHVVADCLSACTLIFVSGNRRSASANARFGFHAYHLDASYPDVWINIQEQQAQDKELFLSRGVSSAFVEKINASDPSTLWTPTLTVLMEVGFLHQQR